MSLYQPFPSLRTRTSGLPGSPTIAAARLPTGPTCRNCSWLSGFGAALCVCAAFWADATGALGAALWLAGGERGIELVASHGAAASGLDRAEELARAALEAWRPLALERSDGLPDDAW